MSLENFVYWLNGFFEISGSKTLAEEQVQVLEVGMLPPPDYTETYYSGDEPGGYNPNFWEEE